MKNGGRLVIVRGATGGGKTTALEEAQKIAKRTLAKKTPRETLECLSVQLNNLIDDHDTLSDDQVESHIWKEFSRAIDEHLPSDTSGFFMSEEFIVWLQSEPRYQDESDNIYRFFEKSRRYMIAIEKKTGFGTYDVETLETIVMDDWRRSIDCFSSKDLAIEKIAKLHFSIHRSLGKQIGLHRIFILDNVDHFHPRFQRLIVHYALWLSELLVYG